MTRRSSIRLFHIVAFLALASSVASAQWKIIGNRRFSAFDMISSRSGLAAIHDVGLPILCRFAADTVAGLLTVSDVVTSIVAPDSNIAYFTVKNDGLYLASSHWSAFNRIYADDSLMLLAVSGKRIIARHNDRIIYSTDGGQSFLPAAGLPLVFLPTELITAVVAYNDNNFVAVNSETIYVSRDGGANWNAVFGSLRKMSTLYCDKINKIMYAGGGGLYRSVDSGWHWQKMTSSVFDLLGPIAGAHDCTGALYIGPDRTTRGELLRTTTMGKFFQSVGSANLGSTQGRMMEIFDRGSTVFWLDSSGIFSVTRVGVDSTLTDSVASRVLLINDTVLHNSYCPSAAASNATIRIGYDQCTGIVIDSIKAIKANPSFTITFKSLTLRDSMIEVPFTFRARSGNADSVKCKIYFHSTYTQNFESIPFTLRGIADVGVAGYTSSQTDIDFGKTPVDSTRKASFIIKNTGCDTLVLYEVVSSAPSVFEVAGAKMPFSLAPNATTFTSVGFTAHEARLYLETVNIRTNIGTRFVTLRGVGTTLPEDTLDAVVRPTPPNALVIYPNPASDRLTVSGLSANDVRDIVLFDALGRRVTPTMLTSTADAITLDLHELGSGTYVLIVGATRRITFVKY